MTNTFKDSIEQLQRDLSGPIAIAGDPSYVHLSAAFNKVGTPLLIVTAHDADDVSKTVNFARTHKLTVSVRSSGHGIAGYATNDGGVVIDLSSMRAIDVLDEEKCLIRIEPGTPWGEVAAYLEEMDMAITSGDNGGVAVGGLTLGGGIGWMVRKYGLTIDRLRAVEVVLADGRQVRASANENADLFWALRGGGGNFGVATAFEFEAHRGTDVISGSFYYPMTEATEVLGKWAKHMKKAPPELSSTAILFPPTPGQDGVIDLKIVFAGSDEKEAVAAIEAMSTFGNLIEPRLAHASYSSLVPYRGSASFGQFQAVHGTALFNDLSPEALAAIVSGFGKAEDPLLEIRALGGAMAEVAVDETAFAHRSALFMATSMKMVGQGVSLEEAQKETSATWEPIWRYADGMYVNFAEYDMDRCRNLVYPEKTYQRLVEVKKKYDPNNLFHQNVNIIP